MFALFVCPFSLIRTKFDRLQIMNMVLRKKSVHAGWSISVNLDIPTYITQFWKMRERR